MPSHGSMPMIGPQHGPKMPNGRSPIIPNLAPRVAAPRSRQSYNAIGDAITHATALITAAPFRATERVIDVAGDGPDMRSSILAPDARDAAVAQGITINGLAIEIAPVTRGNEPLHVHYERNVMGGPGAFVMVAETRRDFARAMRAKMLREIA